MHLFRHVPWIHYYFPFFLYAVYKMYWIYIYSGTMCIFLSLMFFQKRNFKRGKTAACMINDDGKTHLSHEIHTYCWLSLLSFHYWSLAGKHVRGLCTNPKVTILIRALSYWATSLLWFTLIKSHYCLIPIIRVNSNSQ